MSSSTEAPAPGKSKPVRPGSTMSAKQIAQTVKDGRRVVFTTAVGEVDGYVGGMDDFHWLVVTPDAVRHLVHKSACLVTLSNVSTLWDEELVDVIDKVVAPFRQWVLRTYFGHSANPN